MLSADADLTTTSDNVNLGTVAHTGALAVGGSYLGSLTYSPPLGMVGTYHLFVVTDSGNLVNQGATSADNNSAMSVAFNLLPPTVAPDLVVTSVTAPSSAQGGSLLHLGWTVTNTGNGNVPASSLAWIDRLYLSTNGLLDSHTQLAATVLHSGGLPAGQSYSSAVDVSLAADANSTYTLFVVTDADQQVYESNNANNTLSNVSSGGTVVTPQTPADLVTSAVTVPTSTQAGQNINVQWDVTNTGANAAPTLNWYDSVYLSKDQFLDTGSAIYLGTVPHQGGLTAGAHYTGSLTGLVPLFASGSYFAIVVTDYRGSVYEAGATANNTAVSVAVTNVNVAPPADLTPTAVQGPGAGIVGQATEGPISWTVTNLGGNPATGAWYDAVYLSLDTKWDAADPLIGRVLHTGDLASNSSYSGSFTPVLPAGLVPANYHFIVRSDVFSQVRESDKTNNQVISSGTLRLDMATLALDSQATGSISNGEDLYFKLDVTAGQALNFAATFSNPNAAEFYVRYGAPPSRSSYDQVYATLTDSSQKLSIPATRSGTYYVLLHGREGAFAGASYSLLATEPTFGISGISVTKGGNSGHVTMVISGTHFTPNATALLVNGQGTALTATTLNWYDSTTLWATFDLQGAATGLYSVEVNQSGLSSQLPDAFTIMQGLAVQPTVTVLAPGSLRPGQSSQVTIQVTNTSLVDVPAPLIFINATNAAMQLPNASGYTVAGLTLLATSATGPAGILAPGATAVLTIPFQPTVGIGSYYFQANLLNSPTSVIDWSSYRESMQPAAVPHEAWTQIFANLTARLGTTWGDYQAALATDASYLSLLGRYTNDPSELMQLDYTAAANELPTVSLQSSTDIAAQTQGMAVSLSRTYLQPLEYREHLGRFGYGWFDQWDTNLTTDASGNVTILQAGAPEYFRKNADGTFSAAPQDLNTLTLENGIYRLVSQSKSVAAYQSNGQLAYLQDANGNRINASFSNGLLTTLTDSVGNTLTFSYNTNGRVTQVTGPNGAAATYTYDAAGTHLISATGELGTVQYAYNAQNALTQITLRDGSHQNYEYDTQQRLTRQFSDGGLQSLSYTYGTGLTITTTDATGRWSTRLSRPDGQAGIIYDATGSAQRLDYDLAGNLTTSQDVLGVGTSYQYDARSRLVRTVDALGNAYSFTYDTSNNMTSFTNANGATSRFTYDVGGNLTSQVDPVGLADLFSYDTAGNVTSTVNRRGQQTHATYNAQNLLTRADYADGTFASYIYDARGNLLTATDPTGTTTYTYNARLQLTQVVYPGGKSLSFTYDAAGRRTSWTDETGYKVQYQYDAIGRLTKVLDGSGALLSAYTYDNSGRVTRLDHGNGTYTVNTYTATGKLESELNHAPDGSINSQFIYTYDLQGRMVTMTTLAGMWTYTYDVNSQLTGVRTPDGREIQYAYDAQGNRIAVTDQGTTTNYISNSLDQYTRIGDATLTYDADGNLNSQTDSSGTTTYTYDTQNRLISSNGPSGVFTFTYDSFGHRIASSTNGVTTCYTLDPYGLNQRLVEYNGSGNAVAHNIFANQSLVARATSAGTGYYDFELNGSTAGISGSAGTYLNSYAYLPFGQIVQASSSSFSNPFTFSGQWGVTTDASGLTSMGARFYSAEQGRFTTQDPLGIQGGDINLYRYALNNYTLTIDPSGLSSVSDWWIDGGCRSTVSAVGAGVLGIGATAVTAGNPYAGIAGGTAGWIAGDYVGKQVCRFDPTPTPTPTPTPRSPSSGGGPGGGRTGGDSASGGGGGPGDGRTGGGFGGDSASGGVGGPGGGGPGGGGPGGGGPGGGGPGGPGGGGPGGPGGGPGGPGGGGPGGGGPGGGGPGGGGGGGNIVPPHDPNDMVGPTGFTAAGIVGYQPLAYTVDFENDKSAAGPADEVVVTNALDPNLDWRTLQLTEIAFGSHTLKVPAGLSFFSTTVDLRPDGKNLLVLVQASLNSSTGVLRLELKGIDPDTGEMPVDPTVGILPPNNAANDGQGHVSYTIKPKRNLPSGSVVNNTAAVVFDTQPPILTNTVTNLLDVTAPSSLVTALPAISDALFSVDWAGNDDDGGAGIAGYDVYVATDGGPFQRWLNGTTSTTATYTATPGHRYAFFSVARDNVGNLQPAPAQAQAWTQVLSTASETTTTLSSSSNPAPFGAPVTFTAVVTAAQTGNGNPTGSVQFAVDGTLVGNPVTLINGAASFQTSTLGLGTHVVTASYVTNDTLFNSSMGTLAANQRVNATGTTTSVSPSLTGPVLGQELTFTAQVVATAPSLASPAGGTVQFQVDGLNFGASTPLVAGGVSIKISTLSAGTHTISAIYSGDGQYFLTSTGSTSILVSVAPTVTGQPVNSTVLTGTTASFTATATGTPSPSVQWQVNTGSGWTDLPGATLASYSFTASLAEQGNQYRARFTNSVGVATTNAASLVVLSGSASFTKSDATTQGSWKQAYGANGYNISQDASAGNPTVPAYATVTFNSAENYTWNPSTSNVRALQKSAGNATDRIAGTWYSADTFSIDVQIHDGQTHQVALYALDWSSLVRSESIEVIDDATGIVLDTRSIANFHNGVYQVWEISGSVTFKITNTNVGDSTNAVLSGLFFGGTPTLGSQATFLNQDATTGGDWKGTYGADGFNLSRDTSVGNPTVPAYAAVAVQNASSTVWNGSTANPNALLKAAAGTTDRLAATWYSNSSFSMDVQINDGKAHQVALYAVDWDHANRTETIQVIDSNTGTVLDTQSLANFQNGVYLAWNISGNVTFKVTNTGNTNAVLSGLFFGSTPAATSQAAFVKQDAATGGNWKGAYGIDGFDISQDQSAGNPTIPGYASVAAQNALNYTWNDHTNNGSALQHAAPDATNRIAAAWYSQTSFSLDVQLHDDQTHQVALYAVDWDHGNRTELIQVIDTATGAVLNTQSLANFGNGVYLVWNIKGNVTFKVVNTSSSNAVLSGLFFG